MEREREREREWGWVRLGFVVGEVRELVLCSC